MTRAGKQSVLVLSSLLCACAGAPTITTLSVCPEPVTYSHATQLRAQAELRELPADSALAEMMRDYAKEREQLRQC